MKKTEVVHARISPETKKECDHIFQELGITTSYAITLFLNQVRLRRGFPFEIDIPEKQDDLVSFAENINSIDNKKPSPEAKQIMKLYSDELIDLETAEKAIRKLHKI